jgi:hypothetical protein
LALAARELAARELDAALAHQRPIASRRLAMNSSAWASRAARSISRSVARGWPSAMFSARLR